MSLYAIFILCVTVVIIAAFVGAGYRWGLVEGIDIATQRSEAEASKADAARLEAARLEAAEIRLSPEAQFALAEAIDRDAAAEVEAARLEAIAACRNRGAA